MTSFKEVLAEALQDPEDVVALLIQEAPQQSGLCLVTHPAMIPLPRRPPAAGAASVRLVWTCKP